MCVQIERMTICMRLVECDAATSLVLTYENIVFSEATISATSFLFSGGVCYFCESQLEQLIQRVLAQ